MPSIFRLPVLRMCCALGSLFAFGTPLAAANIPAQVQIVNNYSDLADLALASPVVLIGSVQRTIKLSEKDAPGIPPSHTRFFVEAAVQRLISSASPISEKISYIVDMPFDSRGKPPRFKGAQVILFLRPSPGRPDQFSLIAPDAQVQWSEEVDGKIRSILTDARTANGRVAITGVASAFHVRGSVPGESETQIFLSTRDQNPVSLSILRRPDQAPQWAVSLGEIVDDTSKPAGRDTLLWYRLACFLPPQLPDDVLDGASTNDRSAMSTDYRFVLDALGSCGRQRK